MIRFSPETPSMTKHSAVIVLAALATPALAGFTNQGFTLFSGSSINHDSRSASLADIDNDGDLDLYFQGSAGSQKLYRNNLVGGAGLGFTDISSLLPSGLTTSWSAAWADINGDRLPDVFVGQSNLSGNTGSFLQNAGSFGFSNQSAPRGLADPGFHQNLAWNDIDRDNDLDLIIGMEGPERHEIYLQQPGGNFTAAGAAAGFQIDFGSKAYGMALGDTDNDGDVDVYISTCIGSNFIRNNFFDNRLKQTGSLSFVDIADTNGTQFMTNSYHAEFADFNDDGLLDLFLVGADREPSKIYRNNGGNQFTDVDTLTGRPLLTNVGGDLNGGRAIDYDNDGDLDLFFHDHLSVSGSNAARKLYRNDGNWLFADVTVAEGLNEVNRGSYDSAWGDLDRDGDMDLIATTDSSWNERIYISDESTGGNKWLQVVLEGPVTNTSGVGATIYATIGGKTLRREANTNAGTFNQSDLPVHFGLGSASVIDELRVVWTDGRVQVLDNVAVNQYLTVEYADLLTGDFNGDGLVDAADYTVWRSANGHVGYGNAADANGDGAVNTADYNLWQANYGRTVAAIAVPEPVGALMIASLALGAGLTERRRYRKGSRTGG